MSSHGLHARQNLLVQASSPKPRLFQALDPCAALGLPHLAKALRLWNAGGCPRGRGKVTAGLVFGDILEVDADPLGGPAQA